MGVPGGVLAGELAPVGELVLVVVAGEAAVVLGPLGLHPASTASTAAAAAPSTVERRRYGERRAGRLPCRDDG
ncbi:hypothetical protein [Kineococcus sp. SYSU DK005]|uniref:hypothetical protein n=1 Tax=Kineococcus sp. SYSU DK005 TaxID=3383126 RepID=UPI003D7E3C10